MAFGQRLINTSAGGAPGTTGVLDILGDGSCVACYNFNGDVTDLSGNHNGTINGTVNFVEGKFGQAVDLSSGFITAPQTNFPTGQSAGTISCWISTNSLTTGNTGIIGYGSESVNALRQLGMVSNNTFTYFTYNGPQQSAIPYIPSDGTWIHLMVADSGNSKNLWINGVLRNGGNWQVATGGGGLKIGSSYLGGFGGKVDQVRIFNKLISSPAEAQLIYTEGL